MCNRIGIVLLAAILSLAATAHAEDKQLLWGDTHLHTSNSFDAFLNQNQTADPNTAYRYARGLPVVHPGNRARIRIGTPLDFLVVADHAEFYGAFRHTIQRGIPRDEMGAWDSMLALFTQTLLRQVVAWDYGREFFASLLPATQDTPEEAATRPQDFSLPGAEATSETMWREAVRIADQYNEPGTFTALIGWEWSSIPAGANLHRVVMSDTDAETASSFQPFSSLDSPYPEDLWAWLEETQRATGARFVAIPHNSNISKGRMFSEVNLRGEPMDEDSARIRARWEPVVEVTQFKGDSETHPDLSPEDPFADFELYPHYIQNDPPPYEARPGDYIRSALRIGLMIEEKIGFNPYRFGMIGSTDAHTGIASAEEPNFWGKFPRDSTPEAKSLGWRDDGGPSGWSMSASGLAAVWAEENTREAILDAFARREVYATTGPRIVLRLDASFGPGGDAGAMAPALDEEEVVSEAPLDTTATNGVAVVAADGEVAVVAADGEVAVVAADGEVAVVAADGEVVANPVGERESQAADPVVDEITARAVPMGGVLPQPAPGESPRLRVHAMKDPKSGNLDRIQIIKGWIDAAGETHERIYDVAWSGDRQPDADGRVGPVGSTVDRTTASYTNDIGAAELVADWTDPDFDPMRSSFYYVRVLEIPTPRHSLYDAAALGLDPDRAAAAREIQERAYSSPVWFRPKGAAAG
jgi:hypothetical protein